MQNKKVCANCKFYHDKSCSHFRFGNPEQQICDDFAEDERNMNPHDAVNHPAHYTQGGIECIDALKAATVGLSGIEAVCTANAIKYLWRWKHKNGAQDIDKAIWYLNRLKLELEDGNARNKSE